MRISDSKKADCQIQTKQDTVLQKVKEFCQSGWQQELCKDELLKYFTMRRELHVIDDLVFYQDRIVVPHSLIKSMLALLHEGHFGINRTINRPKEIMFWPNMSNDIKTLIRACKTCEVFQYANVKEPLIFHDMSNVPFQKIASDIMKSSDIMKALKIFFANFGVPDVVISDNMPYSSFECKQFAREWGFEFHTSSPGYPRSNAFAKRTVQTAKNILKKWNIATHLSQE